MSPSIAWHSVSLADVAATPWRNGGGVTRELAAWPPQGEWQWRMSVAEVTVSGPFSIFEGVQRWFAVLRGAGVALNIAGIHHTLTANSAPLNFDGAAPTACALLAGPTQDFNLMVRSPGARVAERSAQVKEEPALPPWLRASEKPDSIRMLRITATTCIAVYAPKIVAAYAIGTWATARFDQEFIKIPPQSLAWCLLPNAAEITLETDGALWMEIPL